jgi:hypothetical protein
MSKMAAWCCLLAAVVSATAGPTAGTSHAATAPDLRSEIERATSADWRVLLKLFDGREVGGVFQGFVGDWSRRNEAAAPYTTWRAGHDEGTPAIGQAISIAISGGDTLRGNFAGLAGSAIALATDDSGIPVSVNFATIAAIAADGEPTLTPWIELHARFADAPSISGVVLRQDRRVVIVPQKLILSASRTANEASPSHSGEVAAAAILGGLVGALLVCALVAQSFNDANNNCSHLSFGNNANVPYMNGTLSGGPGPRAPALKRLP